MRKWSILEPYFTILLLELKNAFRQCDEPYCNHVNVDDSFLHVKVSLKNSLNMA